MTWLCWHQLINESILLLAGVSNLSIRQSNKCWPSWNKVKIPLEINANFLRNDYLRLQDIKLNISSMAVLTSTVMLVYFDTYDVFNKLVNKTTK